MNEALQGREYLGDFLPQILCWGIKWDEPASGMRTAEMEQVTAYIERLLARLAKGAGCRMTAS